MAKSVFIPKSRHSLRIARRIEREALQRKIERGFSRTTENFSDALTIAKATRHKQAVIARGESICRPPPKVAHIMVERTLRMPTVLAIMAHHKEETGAVPVIHFPSRRNKVVMPSCLGVFGNVIDSSLA